MRSLVSLNLIQSWRYAYKLGVNVWHECELLNVISWCEYVIIYKFMPKT